MKAMAEIKLKLAEEKAYLWPFICGFHYVIELRDGFNMLSSQGQAVCEDNRGNGTSNSVAQAIVSQEII